MSPKDVAELDDRYITTMWRYLRWLNVEQRKNAAR
jgi:hypothetical protein